MPVVGEIEVDHIYERVDVYQDTKIEWKIPDFLPTVTSTHEAYFDSKVFTIGSPFFLRLFPKTSLNDDEISVLLKSNITRNFKIEYNMGLKKKDNSVEDLCAGTIKPDQKYGRGKLILSRQDLQARKSSLIHGSSLILTCFLKPSVLLASKPPKKQLHKLDVLSENLKNLMIDKDNQDITLIVQGAEFKAHKIILQARSPVFSNIFKHDTLEKRTGIVRIPDCNKDAFYLFIEYMYSGKLLNLDVNSALNLYYIAEKYQVQELKMFCVDLLVDEIDVNNFIEICLFSDKFQITYLIEKIQDFFNKNCAKIFVLDQWKNLMKNNNDIASNLLIKMKN